MSGLDHGWDKGEKPNHADFVHGGVDERDFEDEFHGHPKRRKKKTKKKNYPGCPANNNKAHVFVWTSEFEDCRQLFYKFFGFHKYERKACCGCGHKDASRLSERYMAKKEKEWPKRSRSFSRYRWWSWESENEEYSEYRRAYMARYGFTAALYDW